MCHCQTATVISVTSSGGHEIKFSSFWELICEQNFIEFSVGVHVCPTLYRMPFNNPQRAKHFTSIRLFKQKGGESINNGRFLVFLILVY